MIVQTKYKIRVFEHVVTLEIKFEMNLGVGVKKVEILKKSNKNGLQKYNIVLPGGKSRIQKNSILSAYFQKKFLESIYRIILVCIWFF